MGVLGHPTPKNFQMAPQSMLEMKTLCKPKFYYNMDNFYKKLVGTLVLENPMK